MPVKDAQFSSDADSQLFAHDRYHTGKVRRIPVLFGENLRGNIYYNPDVRTAAPAVIWLHPYNYSIGYAEAYGTQGASVFHRIADAGYVEAQAEDLFAFDDVRTGVGVGLRYLLPIGPLRLDAAFNPDRRAGEAEWVVHFAIGMPF